MTVLNFSLSPEATQRVHSALICLSKFSESISLEALPKQLSLSALNSSKSACGAIDLDARRFFSSYTFVPDATAAEPRFTCRLQAKALLAVFRQRYVDSKDKATAIDRCELELRDRGAECRLLVRLSCRHGVLKTYKLTYEAHDVLRALFDAALARNRWRISSTQLKAYMEHFGPKTEQLDFSATNGRAAFTSFTERLLDGKEILKQPLQTSVALDTTDFDEFEVEEGVHVAIAMKDFRAVTLHAESLGAPLEARYSQPGRPLQLHYGAPEGLEARFTLMTLLDTRAVAVAGAAAGAGLSRRVVEHTQPRPQSQSQRSQPAHTPAVQAKPEPTPWENDDDDDALYAIPALRQPTASASQQMPAPRPPPQSHSRSRPPPTQTPRPSQSIWPTEPPRPPAPAPAPASKRPRRPSSPPLPVQHQPADATARLFLTYESSEDSCDLNRELEDDMVLNWDEAEEMEVNGGGGGGGGELEEDRVQDGEGEEEGVGPTQQSDVVVGIFD